MKKAIGQTVRDLKRGVNKKVLKVPSIEQKVLDATSNEPWGPHGALLADIAQATRNYHEYQMIMSVIWKRTNDTGKNWRHVYKALTVLEYLVAHGSERVIDDIREHAYQISTLSDFQYIDSSAKDQGNNVRKKSQSLVVLVNDKERIQEVRQKAAANREKYRNTPAGGMYRPGSSPNSGDRYDDDRGNRDDDRNSYGREREWGSRDDDRYGRDGDRYSRDNEERYGRDGYRDDDNRGRSQSMDDYRYESRSRSADQDRNRFNEDDGQYSSRGSGAKADDHSQDGSSTGRNHGVPPSYEDAVGASRSPPYSDRDGDSSQAYAPKASSPTGASPSHPSTAGVSPPAPTSPPASAPAPASAQSTNQHSNEVVDGFDEFDPRGSFSAASNTSNGAAPATSATEMDLLGSLSESFPPNSFALVPAGHPSMAPEANASSDFHSGPTGVAASPESMNNNQPFDDPFGDGPFKAVVSPDGASTQHQITDSFNPGSSQSLDAPKQTEFGGPFYDATTYMPSGPSDVQSPPTGSTQFVQQEFSNPNQDFDILADILPPSGPSSFVNNSQAGYPAVPPNQSVSHSGFPPTNQPALTGQNAQSNSFQGGFPTQLQPSLQAGYSHQPAESVSQTGFPTQTMALTYPAQAGQASQMGFQPQTGQPNPNFYGTYTSQSASMGPAAAYTVPPNPSGGATAQHNFLSQSGSSVPTAAQMGPQSNSLVSPVLINPSSIGSSAIVPHSSQDKFETKSTVWADTLSRGLVNLNISGSKTNPLSDIGVDFDAINRKEKRMEKPTTATVTSTVTMGKAMGSGSGIGRAGATVLRPTQNPMMGSGMNVGVNGVPGGGMGMGGYGGSQPGGRGVGMGMNMHGNMPGNMGMGMNMPGNMGMGMNNMPGNMGNGMNNMPGNMGMGMNMPGNMGMGMNMHGNMGMGMNMGMGQGANMPPQMGIPPGSTMPGANNHMMGPGNYGQQPYGGYR